MAPYALRVYAFPSAFCRILSARNLRTHLPLDADSTKYGRKYEALENSVEPIAIGFSCICHLAG